MSRCRKAQFSAFECSFCVVVVSLAKDCLYVSYVSQPGEISLILRADFADLIMFRSKFIRIAYLIMFLILVNGMSFIIIRECWNIELKNL